MSKVSNNLKEILMRRALNNSGIDSPVKWDCGEIFPTFHVGSLSAATDVTMLRQHGVSRVLTVAGCLDVTLPTDVAHLVIDIADHPSANILDVLPTALDFLDQLLLDRSDGTIQSEQLDSQSGNEKSVLVHCASGISRSVAVCCAWLMTRKHMSFKDALLLIRKCRTLASPNCGFIAQLEALDECGGDINAAKALYQKRIPEGQLVGDLICAQREEASAAHAKVDSLEVLFKKYSAGYADSTGTATSTSAESSGDVSSSKTESTEKSKEELVLETWLHALLALQFQLDVQAESGAIVKDKAAAMIRKSAASKVARLLDEISVLRCKA